MEAFPVKRFTMLLLGLLMAFGSGCKKKSERLSIGDIPMDSLPLQEFRDSVRMTMTEGDKKVWSLVTTHITRYRNKGGTFVVPVDVVYFTKTGTSHLTADTGWISIGLDTLEALGKVSIHTYDKKSVATTRIVWKKASDKVESDRAVKMVTAEGDVYTGVGFTANTNLSEWRILKNVKARIKNLNKGFLN